MAAICGVVAIHVFGLVISEHEGSRGWWAGVVLDVGSTWVVPVFVMISGALLLAPRAHASGPVAFYRKRFVRIVPALIVWHLVYQLVVRQLIRGQDLDWGTATANLINGKTYTALYFLWLIAGLYVIAPVLAAFLSGGGRRRAGGRGGWGSRRAARRRRWRAAPRGRAARRAGRRRRGA